MRSDDKGNFGVLEFTDRGDYDYALQNLSGKELEGRPIEVTRMSQDDEERSRPFVPSRREPPTGRGRYYEHSRSRSRSSRSRSSCASYSSRSRSSRSIPKEALEENRENEEKEKSGSKDGGEDGVMETVGAVMEVAEEADAYEKEIEGEDGEVTEMGKEDDSVVDIK